MIAIEITSEGVVFADSATNTTISALTVSDVSAEVSRIVASSIPLYAQNGTETARVLRDRYGIELRGLRCVSTIERSLFPTSDEHSALPMSALDCAHKIETLASRASVEERAMALQNSTIEDLWRWPAIRGYRVDTRLLASETARIAALRQRSMWDWRTDLTLDGPETQAFLDRWKIDIRNERGEKTFDKDFYASAKFPRESLGAWESFKAYRAGSYGSNKLTEIRRELRGDRLYPHIHALGAKTGRMAITKPALQNITERLRPLLIADPGCVLIGIDLDRVEPRVVAGLSGDPHLIEAVGRDVYAELSQRIYGSIDHRSRCKTAFLGMFYGQGAASLGRSLGVSTESARALIDQMKAAYPTMARWMDEIMDRARNGETLFTGYGRRLPMIEAAQAYRAISYTVQGTAADLFKELTIQAHKRLDSSASLYLPIHDELVVSVRDDQESIASAREILSDVFNTEFRGVKITGTVTAPTAHFAK